MDETGTILCRQRIPTPAGDYQATVECIVSVVSKLEYGLPTQARVGIGTPGAVSSAGTIKNANSTCLNGKPLLSDLCQRLGREVHIANDADCFALSEAVDGAGHGAVSVFGIILGTGVGGGIVINGQLLSGPNAIAGEWGHNPLPWVQDDDLPAPGCYCGKSACLETYLSGPGVAALYKSETGISKSAEEIFANCDSNNVTRLITDLYFDRLARGLAFVINIIDPEIIVLGGGLSNVDKIYQEVPQRWGQYVFSESVKTQLKKAVHGDSSGVRGAAWL